MCNIYDVVRIKNWILAKNNLTGCSSDIRNGYATCEQQFQRLIAETEKAVLVKTCKGEYWFPKSTVVERKTIAQPSFNSPCRVLDDLMYDCEFLKNEFNITFAEAFAKKVKAVEKWQNSH